ncbi:reprolysin-like metallopeptidase [Rickettsiella endosymbiont of Aleochara curtula]|uniref:reprolysin-like metallopeptidase n=1 Tax=Rickettsiella endosymbiont of Aleochara curtula TaxID=3077936 RepID=UPI00313C47ED
MPYRMLSPSILKKCSVGLLAMLLASTSHASVQNFWQDMQSETPLNLATEKPQPAYYRIISLNDASLNALRQDLTRKKTTELLLPLPEGDFSLFTVSDAHTMPLELAKRYPSILSLKGFDKEGRRLRLDISQQGLQAMVFDTTGNWLIQSVGNKFNHNQAYQSFRLEALHSGNARLREKLTAKPNAAPLVTKPHLINDNLHREYRIAIAMNSDYAKKYGATIEGGLANAVRTLNRINEIYETDFGIHLILAKDNDKIIFANPATDPYLNLDPDQQRAKNIAVLNAVIGPKNFDLGHLFSRAIGGGTSNGVVCLAANKADGSSGSATSAPDGRTTNPPDKDISESTFDLLAAHEIGHEFNANHTFNGCDRDPDSASSAYEPGSGSTIMSYAGECFDEYTPPMHQDSLENLQDHKDPYFHASTIAEIKAFVTGPANVCAKKLSNPNRPPVIDPRSTAPFGKRILTIPANTPFVLHAYARSSNRNAKLNYTWEQMDLGPAQPIKTPLRDDGLGPIFRSYLPNSSGERIFPRLDAVLGKQALGLGEVYPSTTRKLHFRLTVRDNLQDQATTAHADMLINVLNTGFIFSIGPVNAPWKSGEKRWVNWNVAGTNHEPIACKTVRIDLSTDGGYTFLPKSLASQVPNQGSFAIIVPRLAKPTDYARLRVSCNENLFFAVSPHNFSIIK